ncbi:hypothetical protein SORBI_3001G172900 [Sorghum bicolor]|uniref:Uncharacterized protein n=1 Tax=Sorghum bicolor TaxID=4558 RepID=A0A1B6QJI1_SORBI|nr:hypothetical protein SORBI_3001G172900 [Sorghum bicolor]
MKTSKFTMHTTFTIARLLHTLKKMILIVAECIRSFLTNLSLCAILLSNVLDNRMVKRRSDPSIEVVIPRISCIEPLD